MTVFFKSRSRLLPLICIAGFALVILNGFKVTPIISELFLAGDGDDQMRLVRVRDLLAGQGWFDVRQYRVLPPEGISMHWSRYLDAGIAAILASASMFLPAQMAEFATLILWPSFLACLMVLVLVPGNGRLFGPFAAIGAMVVFLSWSKLGGEFVAPRIDHHNIQILCATALFYLSLVPGRARVLGALGGVVTAFALAIGLEMLPVFATIWGMMALRHAFGEEATGDWLLGFGVAISLAAPLLLAGQTPISDWGTLHCDVLALPVMALGAVGVVTTLVPVLGARLLVGPIARIGVLLVVAGLGLWLAYPLLGQCLAGPYSQVPLEIRITIETMITEALSVSRMLESYPAILGRILLPPMIILILAVVAIWFMRAGISPRQRIALIQAFVIVGVGFVFAAVQIRAANLMTPAIPLLGGFVVHAFSQIPRSSLVRVPAVIVLLLGMPATVEYSVTHFLEPKAATPVASTSAGPDRPRQSCRNMEAMAEAASLPPSLLFNPLNLGPSILVSTSHSVTAASYHRSPEAMWNGVGAFKSETALRDAVAKSGADLLVFCVGGLADGEAMLLRSTKATEFPVWLKAEPGERTYLAVFRVDKAALAAAEGAP
jgi:hypothetical protein